MGELCAGVAGCKRPRDAGRLVYRHYTDTEGRLGCRALGPSARKEPHFHLPPSHGMVPPPNVLTFLP